MRSYYQFFLFTYRFSYTEGRAVETRAELMD